MGTSTIDLNGTGRWSGDAILRRYADYAGRFAIREPRDLSPMEHGAADKRWIYPILEKVIEGIEAGDPACAEIGLELIEDGASMPFGKLLKSNVARALRRGAALSPTQQERIRTRVVEMLAAGYLPREFRQYAKLGRHVGIAQHLRAQRARFDLSNRWVRHWLEYLSRDA